MGKRLAGIVVFVLLTGVFVAAQKPTPKPSPKPATPTQKTVKPADGDKIFELTRIHRLRISLSADEWDVLMTSGGRSTLGPGGQDYVLADGRLAHLSSGFANYLPWAMGDLRIEDPSGKIEFKSIGVRYKGNSSFTRSTGAAPLLANFKLKIDLYGTKGTWDGHKTFNLQSGVVDASRMRDHVMYWLFRTAGVPAPRTTYAEVVFNVPGVYQDTSAGLFTIIEDVNGKFIERVLPPGKGLLMKPEQLGGGIRKLGDSWSQYATKLRPDREATLHEQQRVMDFGSLISGDVETFRANVRSYLDVDQFLRFLAVNAFATNWDSYLTGSHNFYFYLDPRDDRFRFVPWDQDLSLQMRGMPGGGMTQVRIVRPDGTVVNGNAVGNVVVNGNFVVNGATVPVTNAPTPATPGADILRPANASQTLITRLLDDPTIEAQYRAIIRELSATAFSVTELTKLMDALEAVNPGRTGSPRDYVLLRARTVEQLIASWDSWSPQRR